MHLFIHIFLEMFYHPFIYNCDITMTVFKILFLQITDFITF